MLLHITTVLLLAPAPKALAQFTNGNIVVLQVGDGSTLVSTATAFALKEFTPGTANQATAVSTVTMPTTGTHRITMSGSGNTEGLMTLSTDSLHLVIPGYDAATGTAGISSTASATVSRVIDTVSILGIPGRAATSNTAFSATSFRSATKNAANNYWGVGGAGGTYYFGNTGAPVIVQTATVNNRGILAANGNMYISSGAGVNGIYKIPGQPTTVGSGAILVPFVGTGNNPLALAVNPAETIIYVADSRNASPGGIQRWDLVSGAWINTYNFSLGASSANGAGGLTVDWSGTNPVIYATSSEVSGNRLVKITDVGAASAVTVLATAPANYGFRGVAFAPKAAPTCTNPVLTSMVFTPKRCTVGGTATITLTNAITPTFSWTGPNSYVATTQNITGLAPGTYLVTVTVPGGCATSSVAFIADSTAYFAASIFGGNRAICQGDSSQLNTFTGTGYTYQYKLGGIPIPGATNVSYKATVAGSYTVTINASPNCLATSTPIILSVNATPPASITPAGPITACPQDYVQLHSNRATGLNYQWTYNDTNLTSIGQDTVLDFIYISGTIKVKVTNIATGCTSVSNGVTVNRFVAPDVRISPANANICAGDTIKLSAARVAGSSYQWKFGGNNIPGATDSTLRTGTAGDYSIRVTTINGCVDSSVEEYLMVKPSPVAAFTSAADSVCQNQPFSLSAISGLGNTYSWRYRGQTVVTSSNYYLVPGGAAGHDSLRLVVVNSFGCADTSYRVLTAVPLPIPVISFSNRLLSTGAYATYQWAMNGVMITGANSQAYTPTVNGNYSVTVTDSFGCSGVSAAAFPVVTLAIPTLAGQNDVIVYPNPADQYLTIKALQPVNVLLRDVQGKMVLTASDAKTVNIAQLANGFYFLTITDREGMILKTTRVIKTSK